MPTECFFSFDMFEIHSDTFLGCICVVGMLTVHKSTKFLILFFMFLKYVFFLCLFLMQFLCTNFFIFKDTVWLVSNF